MKKAVDKMRQYKWYHFYRYDIPIQYWQKLPVEKYGVRYFNELTNMAILTEEVGEVARIIARVYGEQSSKSSDLKKELPDELADVLFVLICIANQTGINLTEAFHKNLEKKTNRDSKRHWENPAL